MNRFVDLSWFFLIEFISIALASILWNNFPGLRWQPLLIVIAPLILRISAHKSPFKLTPFDIPIVIFLLTAGLGVWAAYQPAAAWTKFWLILTAIMFYYLLARQPTRNLWWVAGILSLLGFAISIFFFLSDNWELQANKFQLIGQIGTAWMRVRSDFNLTAIHPNDVAGIAGIAIPFSVALTLECRRKKLALGSLLFGLMALLTLIAILLTASRGTWMAVGLTVGIWLLWGISSWLTRHIQFNQRVIFIIMMGLLVCLVMGYMFISQHGRLSEISIGVTGAPISDRRFHLFWSAIELIKDVPFTGGGLDSFPGLYSSYILINPNYIQGYSHNLFLDASLQQGILGGLVLTWIYLGSVLWLALHPNPAANSLLSKAILSSLLIIIFLSLVDDIVYKTMYIPLLFFVPGMAVGLINSTTQEPEGIKWHNIQNHHTVLPVSILLILVVSGLFLIRKPLLSAWYTNLGTVEMARVELSDFPTGKWNEGQKVDLLSLSETHFNRALDYEPENPRAHYRLGLIALLRHDFTVAVDHLEAAYRGDPYHRGVLKALGFSYIWNGQIEEAAPLLSFIPESNQELAIYPWWWREQGRPDLAAYAEQYLLMNEPRD